MNLKNIIEDQIETFLYAGNVAIKLRNEGLMIYENRSKTGVSYRVGTPSKAIIAAGINKVFGKQVAYSA